MKKLMPYVLPAASILVLVLLLAFAKPALTGFFVASPQLNAEIRITAEEVLPEDTLIYIFLEKNSANIKEVSSSTMREFVETFLSENNLMYMHGKNSQIDYEGYGYLGSGVFNIKINTDNLEKGIYILKTQLIWQDKIVSETQQEIKF